MRAECVVLHAAKVDADVVRCPEQPGVGQQRTDRRIAGRSTIAMLGHLDGQIQHLGASFRDLRGTSVATLKYRLNGCRTLDFLNVGFLGQFVGLDDPVVGCWI